LLYEKKTASWKLHTVIQNIMLNKCPKTVHHWSAIRANKCSQHTAKLIQNTFHYYPYINSYDIHKVPFLQARNLNFENIRQRQCKTKQQIV